MELTRPDVGRVLDRRQALAIIVSYQCPHRRQELETVEEEEQGQKGASSESDELGRWMDRPRSSRPRLLRVPPRARASVARARPPSQTTGRAVACTLASAGRWPPSETSVGEHTVQASSRQRGKQGDLGVGQLLNVTQLKSQRERTTVRQKVTPLAPRDSPGATRALITR